MVGLPAAGKTTRAKKLAEHHRALRLTPDTWMIPLFGESEADGKRDVLEGRLISLALEALRLGTSVVLDFGCWARDERSALRWLARSAGASCQVVYLPVDRETQLVRIAHRQASTPEQTFPISAAEIDRWRETFQAPDAAELDDGELPGPPASWSGWLEWAVDRWPSLRGVFTVTGRCRPLTEATIQANETTVPMLPCVSADDTLAFYQALGFQITYKQTKPYLYLALSLSGFELHFKRPPTRLDPSEEHSGGCLVMVDAVAPYHAAFSQAMRQAYGKVLASGRPRITRYRPGASRFTLIDPSGNSIVFIRRDEPEELEYGGSKKLEGLARVLDNARIYREFKNDDRAAYRAITSGLRKYGAQAPAVDRALALANLIELATILNELSKIEVLAEELRTIPLTEPERKRVDNEVRGTTDLGLPQGKGTTPDTA